MVRYRQEQFGIPLALASVAIAALPYAARLVINPPHLPNVALGEWAPLVLAAGMIWLIFLGEWRLRWKVAAGRTRRGLVAAALHRARWYGAALGLFLFGVAASIALDVAALGPVRDVRVRDIEAGAVAPKHLRLEGVLDLGRARWRRTRTYTEHYIPVVSEPGHEPVALVLRVPGERFDSLMEAEVHRPEQDSAPAGHYQGIILHSAKLGDEARQAFERAGTPLRPDCVEMEYGLTPAGYAARGWMALWAGLGAWALVGLFLLIERSRASARREENVAGPATEL